MSDPEATDVASLRATLPDLVLLVRHGATEWSENGRHTGRTDLELIPLGVEQATRAGGLVLSLLAGRSAVVFTSPLRRAADTAALAMPNNEIVAVDALMEYDYGAYEGLTSAEIIERQPEWNLFSDGCPGGESLQQVSARCDAFVAKLERTAAGRAAVVFTHGHLSRILASRLIGLPATTGRLLENDTASVGVITMKRGDLVLAGWNLRAP